MAIAENEDLYSVVLADLSETERERVRDYAEQFGIEPTDAVWSIMIVLGRYSDIYSAVPSKIELTVRALLEKIQVAAGDSEGIRSALERSLREAVVEIVQSEVERLGDLYQEVPERIDGTVRGFLERIEKANQAEADAARTRMQRSFTEALVSGLVRPEGRKEVVKWGAVTLGIITGVLGTVCGLSYWAGFDHGRARGFNAGAEGRAVSNWAVSPEGMGAYDLWRSGELEHLLACNRPGWKVQGAVCVPLASEGTVYGWKVR